MTNLLKTPNINEIYVILFAFVMACLTCLYILSALKKREIGDEGERYLRETDPVRFWITIIGVSLMGIGPFILFIGLFIGLIK